MNVPVLHPYDEKLILDALIAPRSVAVGELPMMGTIGIEKNSIGVLAGINPCLMD